MDLIADTSFLVGLWRRQAWATSFAGENPNRVLGIPWVVLGEFWHGAHRAGHDPDTVKKFLGIGLPLLEVERVIPEYANLCSKLQESRDYAKIGQNDLWIGATSLAYGKPLVSRYSRHFGKMEGIRIQALTGE